MNLFSQAPPDFFTCSGRLQSEMDLTGVVEPQALERQELLHRLSVLKREQGMDWYVPNAMQLKAHQCLARTILYIGGNRSGKSTWGAMELCFHLTRQYPSWFPMHRRYTHPIKAVIVCTEFPIVERVIEPKLFSYLPREYIKKARRTPQGYLSRLVCMDGSTVDVLTNEMDDMAFESADWDVYWGDEPQKKTKFYAIQRGLVDRKGITLLTFTPLTEPWIKEELVDKADGTKLACFTVNIRDNKFDIQGKTILEEDAIQEFEAKLPEDVKLTRLSGQFFHLRGLVYPEYDSNVHEWQEIDQPGRLLKYQYPDPVICALDPHDRLPHHALWAWVDRQDNIFVDRELIFHGTLKELGKQLLITEVQAGYRMKRRLIDPNFGRKPQQVGGSFNVIQELASKPFPIQFGEACDDKETGRAIVKRYLHYDRTKPLSVTNSPKLYFHKNRCIETIRSIRNHQYDEWKGKAKDDRDLKEAEKPKDTHGADCIRYLCISRPTFDRLMTAPDSYKLEESAY